MNSPENKSDIDKEVDILHHRLRLLILNDVDIDSAIALAETLISGSLLSHDAIIICGPMSHNTDLSSPEAEAVAIADMASVIAHLENICCRVLYVPGDLDPVKVATSIDELHLTPNSVNIHARSLPLADQLYISGFMEKEVDLNDDSTGTNGLLEDFMGQDDEVMTTQVQSSSSSSIIEEILRQSIATCFPTAQKSSPSATLSSNLDICGIFVFNYKFAHSLNHFLFFQTQLAQKANVRLLIIPSFLESHGNSGSGRLNFEFPRVHNKYTIAAPRSLRLDGSYMTVELVHSSTLVNNDKTGDAWSVTSMEEHTLDPAASNVYMYNKT